MNKLRVLLVFLSLGYSGAALSDFAPTPAEVQMCKANGYPGYHFCDCVRFVHRANASMLDKAALRHNTNEAIGGCNYFLSKVPANDPWVPNAYLQIGLAKQLQGKQGEALSAIYKALQLNPRLLEAYLAMANLYADLNDKKKALEIVTEGLRHVPDSQALQKRYQRLGGALPYPTPYEQRAAQGKAADIAQGKTEAPVPQAAAAMDTNKPADATEQKETRVPPAVGSSTNPWCRFCADVPADKGTSPK